MKHSGAPGGSEESHAKAPTTMLAALFVSRSAVPFAALADQATLGVPDLGCQTPDEWRTHDYGAPATGPLVFLPWDGNLEECGNTYGLFRPPEICTQVLYDPGQRILAPAVRDRPPRRLGRRPRIRLRRRLARLQQRRRRHQRRHRLLRHARPPPPGRHRDRRQRPPRRLHRDGGLHGPHRPLGPPEGLDCGDSIVQPCDPNPPGHSTQPAPLGSVIDLVNNVLYALLNSEGATCTTGDFSKPCLDSCALDFAPGADGAYVVFVGPTLAGNVGEPPVAAAGHVHL